MKLRVCFCLGLGLLAAGCSPPAPHLPLFPHDSAVASALQKLDAQLAVEVPEGVAAGVDSEQIGGLVHMLANSSGRTRGLPLEEIKTLGEGVIAPLVVIATLSEREPGERLAAIELLAEFGGLRATRQLLQLCEKSPEDWIRRQAAWRLGSLDADWIVPRLILRLKYEMDHETAIWIADSLARYGNYSGQLALWNIRRDGLTLALRAAADEHLVAAAQLAGASDADELWQLWYVADPEGELLRTDPSTRLQREVWGLISDLSGEHFQLRGVDDARFVLSQMGPWISALLARALHDTDVYVRVHTAQCLARMGSRAVRAGPSLLAGLGDAELAPAAAAALGVISYPSAEPVLRRLMEDAGRDHELRVACASALGSIGLPASRAALSSLLERAEPFDLRQRAAIALCQLGAGRGAAAFLLAALDDPRADRFGAESALGDWLESLEGLVAEELFAQWRGLEESARPAPTSDEAEARLKARGALLRERLDQLGAQ